MAEKKDITPIADPLAEGIVVANDVNTKEEPKEEAPKQ